jgi:DNA-binding CsgD family transcriptional regulator
MKDIQKEPDKHLHNENENMRKDGKRVWVVWTNKAITVEEGKPVEILSVGNDITKRKKAEQEIQRRTAELKKVNTQLKYELNRSRKLEQALVERERALEAKTQSLEETNTALKVLLEKREQDKSNLGNTVLNNMKELVHPFLTRLKQSSLDATQKAYLEVVETNLKQVVSPFSQILSVKYADLTPTEIRVANLVKDGRSTKEIAELLGSSKRTVDFHRKRLREKLAIRNEKVNLRSYLLSLIK